MPDKRHRHMQQKKMIYSLEKAVPYVRVWRERKAIHGTNRKHDGCSGSPPYEYAGTVSLAHFPLNFSSKVYALAK